MTRKTAALELLCLLLPFSASFFISYSSSKIYNIHFIHKYYISKWWAMIDENWVKWTETSFSLRIFNPYMQNGQIHWLFSVQGLSNISFGCFRNWYVFLYKMDFTGEFSLTRDVDLFGWVRVDFRFGVTRIGIWWTAVWNDLNEEIY